MGREIRRVPPNWEHPRDEQGNYIALYDEDITIAGQAWLDECMAWNNGTHPDVIKHPEWKEEYPFFWMWDGNPPDPKMYRPRFEDAPTWYQVYETISEGTPVTPPFATKEELTEYLVRHGDFWDQRRNDGGWSRKNAERFVSDGWAPSLVMEVSSSGETVIKAPRDGA